MNRRRQASIGLSAAVLAGVLVYGVYELQLRQIRLEETVQVVASKAFIGAGTRLGQEHLTMLTLPRSAVATEMLTDVKDAIGMETAIPLGSNEPLLAWKIGKYRLLPSKGQSTFQIPREYVKSIAGGIRAGDEVLVYLSGEETTSRKMYERPVTVAGVKTAANIEIDDPKNPNLLSLADGDKEAMYASRRDANGTVDSVNLNLTEEQWLMLDSACKEGKAKLIIASIGTTIRGAGEEVTR
ncbi:flagellar biosynthesis protein FlgA [Cohnella soli]|uniref:Flagellar biosynthesis protein FlgA n=1 Tax=Cohnella soli TaxID=425005 RepID=A0ABW0I2V7_9BACL